MKILVTGANGFLGSRLARYWSSVHDVYALVRPAASLHRLDGASQALSVVRAVATELQDTVRAVAPDVVVHTACAYGRAGETPRQVFEANVAFGVALMDALTLKAGGQVVFVNTATVLAPDVSLYALTKHQFSEWGRHVARTTGSPVRFVDVLLQHMYGPGDDVSKFTSHVIDVCRRNQPSLALTAGEQRRDLVYIDDVVTAYDLIVANAHALSHVDAIEVGSGQAPTLRSFVETVHRLTASTTSLDFGALQYRANEAMLCVADISRLAALGWSPAFDLERGVLATLAGERACEWGRT